MENIPQFRFVQCPSQEQTGITSFGEDHRSKVPWHYIILSDGMPLTRPPMMNLSTSLSCFHTAPFRRMPLCAAMVKKREFCSTYLRTELPLIGNSSPWELCPLSSFYLFVVQSVSHIQLFASSRTTACQASLSFTTSQSLLMMPSNNLMLQSFYQFGVKDIYFMLGF